MLFKARIHGARQEIIKGCFPATQNLPRFMRKKNKSPKTKQKTEENRSRPLVSNVIFGEGPTMQIM